MPADDTVSNPGPSRKGKGRARAPPAPKKKPGRKRGAVMWKSSEYLRLYRTISVIRPTGNNQWELVSAQHSAEGTTKQSLELCKMHWFSVLKLKKPTGGAKMHPLHCLALAIDAEICKSTGTYVLNDKDDHDPYGELDVKFQHAKDEMERYKMDPNRPPRFDVPMPDEDAQVDKEIAPPEDLSEDEADGGSKDGDKGQVNVQSDNRDTPYADKAVEDGQICRLPLWSMDPAASVNLSYKNQCRRRRHRSLPYVEGLAYEAEGQR
ncbi:hypothetical protein BN14_11638 [Rhizoctonia solani AG-1 IB]|uniref:Myb-like domain-containing protein n=1 Tax=Thanatephorus cucumeris (strain AG1-IB / isolate 7/3/14) TaxID=1108050 RepID=M5CH96_THACB|nr:hypothetical protein BN14_11638 [Rhizoctonia solani AG-1 IB]